MTIPVHSSAAPERAYRFVLPGTWAPIPLDTPENARAAAQKLVRDRVGRDDRLASLRRQSRDDLVRTAAEAALAGAEGLWLSLEILPGIPLPAAMTTSLVVWDAPEGEPDARLRVYRPQADIISTVGGPVARTRTTGVSSVDPERQSLALEYVVPTPVDGVVLIVNGSAPIIDDGEPYTALFDAVVDSVRWGDLGGAA